MTKELVISANRHETKLAILEDEQLVEIYFQRANEYSLVGSIHKGRVTRVLPGMQSAFVELGLERDAFLYVSDFFEESVEEYERVSPGQDRGRHQESRPAQAATGQAQTTAPAPAPAEAAQRDRGDRQDRGDRRGRSRRRRRGGRGFPDSKYANSGSQGERRERADAEPAAEVSKAVIEEDAERIVLPGESIAKYSSADVREEERDAPRETEQPEEEEPLTAMEAAEAEKEGAPPAMEEGDENKVAVVTGLASEEGLPAVEPEIIDEIQAALAEAEAEEEAEEETDIEVEAEAEAGEGSESAGQDAVPERSEPMEATVREQPQARYIQRGPRRVRRRGGRSDRQDRPERGGPSRLQNHHGP